MQYTIEGVDIEEEWDQMVICYDGLEELPGRCFSFFLSAATE